MTLPFAKPRKTGIGIGVVPEPTLPELPAIDEDTFLETMDRLYPEQAAVAKSSVDVVASVYEWANADPEAFRSDLITKGRTRDTEIMLQGFGFKGEDIDELFPDVTPEPDTISQLLMGALPRVVTPDTIDKMLEFFSDKPDVLRSNLITVGRNPRTEALVQALYPGLTDQGVSDYFSSAARRVEREALRVTETGEYGTFTAGVGGLISNIGGAFKWLGAEGIGENLTKAGQFMQVRALPVEPEPFSWGQLFNPNSYFAQGFIQSLPSLMLLAVPAVGAYGLAGSVAAKLGLGAFKKAILTGIGGAALSRPLESAMEAGNAYDMARAKGMSDEEAKAVAGQVFRNNLKLAGLDAAQIATMFAPVSGRVVSNLVARGLVKTAMIGGKLAFTGLTEGGEEVYQDIIMRQALGEEIVWDAEMQQVFAIGAFAGVAMGAGGDIIVRIQNRVVTGFDPTQKAQFDESKAEYVSEGFSDDIAAQKAIDDMAEADETVAKNIEDVSKQVEKEITIEQLEADTPVEQEVIDNLKEKVGIEVVPEVSPEVERFLAVPEGELAIPTEAVFKAVEARGYSAEAVRFMDVKEMKGILRLPVPTEPAQPVGEVVPEITFNAETTEAGELLVIYRDGEPVGNLRQIGKGKSPDLELRSSFLDTPIRIPFVSLADVTQRDIENIVAKHIPTPPPAEVALQHRGTEPEGIAIADEIGVRYDGIDAAGMGFTEIIQGKEMGSFHANTLEEAQTKLANMREAFAAAEVPAAEPPTIPPTKQEAKQAANELVRQAIIEETEIPLSGDVVVKLTELIRFAEPVREATEKLKHEELVRRTGRAAGILNTAEGKEAFQKSKSALKGELPKADFAPPELQMTDADITDLFNQIRDSEMRYFQKLDTAEALQKLLSGELPTRMEIQRLENMFGPDLAKAILDKRPGGQKAWEITLDVLNLPRAVLASWDLSAPLRQGAPLFWGQPLQSIPAFKPMMQAFFSEKQAKLVDDIIATGKYAELREDAGLYIAPLYGVSAKITQREEAFMSRLARYIPLVSHSERAYVTYLNKVRADVFDSYAAHWEGTGKTMKDYKSLARAINILSGRGPLGKLSELGGILNATFFSPRYQAAKIAFPVEFIRATPVVRRMMARNMLAFVAANFTILMLLRFAGADVEDDPRSSDFGKGKIGNTRLDFWAGWQQYARAITQMITEVRKVSTTGRLSDVERSEILGRFIQGKLSPVAGFVVDILKGESFMGEELSLEPEAVQEQAFNRLVPMFVQDLVEAIEDSGITGALEAMPGMFGVGIQTYGGGYWEQFIDQLGQPEVSDTLPYSSNLEDIYTTKDLWGDVQRRIKGIAVEDMTAQYGFPDIVRAIAQARDIKNVYQERPNTDLVKINADIKEGDTFEQYFLQWGDYQRAFFRGEGEQWIKDNPDYNKYYMGNFSRRSLDLLRQYHRLDQADQEAFLERLSEDDRMALTTNPRQEYLRTRPGDNAQLAIWKQAKVYSMEAYNQTKALAIKLDIPDNAFMDYLPSGEVVEVYFKLSDSRRSDVLKSGTTKTIAEMYLEYSKLYDAGTKGAHGRGEDYRRANNDLQLWGEANLGWKPLKGKSTTPSGPSGIRAFEGLLR